MHFKQCYHVLSEIGIFRSMFLLSVFIGTLYIAVRMIVFIDEALLPAILMGVTIVSIHLSRKDKRFLKIISLNRYLLFVSEYLLVASFIVISLLYKEFYFYALGLSTLIILLPLFDYTFRMPKMKVLQLDVFPKLAYEWKAGMRSQWIILFAIWAASIAFCQYLIAPILGIIVIGFMSTTFYYFCEPLVMLHAVEANASKHLKLKIVSAMAIFVCLVSPLIILAFILHSAHWYFVLTGLILAFNLVVLSIALKYALYKPGGNLRNNSIIVSLMLVCYFFPFLMPLPFIFTIVYYRKAFRNLNNYLDAYN